MLHFVHFKWKMFYPSVWNRVKIIIFKCKHALARASLKPYNYDRNSARLIYLAMMNDDCRLNAFLIRMIYRLHFITIFFNFGPFFLQRWMRPLICSEFEAQLQACFGLIRPYSLICLVRSSDSLIEWLS